MLKPQLLWPPKSSGAFTLSYKFSFSGHCNALVPVLLPLIQPCNKITRTKVGVGNASSIRGAISTKNVKPSVTTKDEKSITVKVEVTVKQPKGGFLSNIGLTSLLDGITGSVRKTLLLELVSTELDPSTGPEKQTLGQYVQRVGEEENKVKYEGNFVVPLSFGSIGAILVQNEDHKEIFLDTIVLQGFPDGSVTIPCNSWVASKSDNPQKRVFFASKSYLPWQTPNGLQKLREKELEELRGNGTGERKAYQRIYDYDKYNDLGDPDKGVSRPVLGGSEYPYPRRCRTGRAPTKKDPLSEKRSGTIFVPRDEAFSEVKQSQFIFKTLSSVLNAALPSLESVLIDTDLGFENFADIDDLFKEGKTLPTPQNQGVIRNLLLRLVTAVRGDDTTLRFDNPELINRDKFSWLQDGEFSRQALAGVNPYSIQLVKEWPLKSKLDPNIYGLPESAITKEIIEREIKGIMTVEEALEKKKLFVLDYHDLLLPYVNKVREIEGTTLYGSRTLFFLTNCGTLKPVAIELTRPPKEGKPIWKKVYTPGSDGTTTWLWRFAKAHVCAHESGYHELVVHWLRTHCCTEPYVIATNRQLSAMHPIYKLLHPHLRYTMQINALARLALISANGVIESSFSPTKYSMELSAIAYNQYWRFDMEGLPADLVKRGMAVEDPTMEHGLKLTIEDYPFAADGLLVWDAIKVWVSDYVNHYYPKASFIENDQELQAWWNEIKTKGHEDKKDEPWWPILKTPSDLIQILTTIIWVASAHHASVNFGQYAYGAYFPNRPAIARRNMPDDDTSEEEFMKFVQNPETTLMQCFPSQIQATLVMAILELLSSHSEDEEYLGGLLELSWDENPNIKAAYERFNKRMKEIEGIIDTRNTDINLRNRTGAGIVPYELLKPFSKPGVTGMGVPNSISI